MMNYSNKNGVTRRSLRLKLFTHTKWLLSCTLLLMGTTVKGTTFSYNNSPWHMQQERVITGNIKGPNSQNIAGATVTAKGTDVHAVADSNGEFKLTVPHTVDTLKITMVGYEDLELPLDSRTVYNIIMQEDVDSLDEVVVVGYGTQRKVQTLGAQSNLNVEELRQPVANLSTVLAGRVSGVVGVQRSGEPGLDNADLWIRGFNTPNSSRPLILVDGVQREFNNIDPNDVESFNILKDASATSVYGVRGANGVILITTKKGRVQDKPSINLDFYQGITEFTKIPQVADGITYLQMANEANVTRGDSPVYSEEHIRKTLTQEDPYLYPNVNWANEIFNRFGNNRKANLNIRGGSPRMTYYVSASYYDEEGLFKTDGLQDYNSQIALKRYNFTSATTIHATKTTQVDLGAKGWISNGNFPGTSTQDIFSMLFNVYPTLYPVMYPDGKEPYAATGGNLQNPYGALNNRGYTTSYENQVMSDIHVRQKLNFLTEGLSARVLFSFDAENSNRLRRGKTPYTYYATGRDDDGQLTYEQTDQGSGKDYLDFERSNGGMRQFYLESALHYDRTFGKHILNGLFLYNQQDRVDATANSLIGSIPFRSRGIVGRGSYSFDDRYLMEMSFGFNGAENFAPNRRFGFFPSFAAGWVPSNEKFWENIEPVIQFLKLRASYGIVGSGDTPGRRFAYIATVDNVDGYTYGKDRDNTISGLDLGEYASNVGWETETNLNLGLELTTLNNALNLQVDVFKRRREDIFLRRASMPGSMGLRTIPMGNLGIVDSEGIDITSTYAKQFGEVGLNFRGTFTFNKNVWVENDQPAQPYSYMETRGHRVYQRFGYIADGFYTQQEIDDPSVARTAGVVQAGDLKFRDLNEDGVIDANDRTAIGRDHVPQIVYGFGATAVYKGFSLGAFFQGVDKVDFYLSNTFLPFREGAAKGSLYANIHDRWTEENPSQNAFYPRLSYGDINQNYSSTSSHWLQKGSFLRLKTLDFGYTFPQGKFSNFGVENLRVYFIGYNLLTFSSFKLFDPELGDGAGNRYPNVSTYSLGFNITF